jgi:hypothetical protein
MSTIDNVVKNPRYSYTELKRNDRPKYQFDFVVTGAGGFPFDMLHHDQCWPVTGDDAATLALAADSEPRSIRMRSYQTPTVERWSSLGWTCGRDAPA